MANINEPKTIKPVEVNTGNAPKLVRKPGTTHHVDGCSNIMGCKCPVRSK